MEERSGPYGDKMFFTVKEAAKLLDVAERTLTRLLKAGEIGGYRIGRQWRMTRANIEALYSGPAQPHPASPDAESPDDLFC